MVNLKNSGANVFFNITTPKFAAQAIKKAHEIGWKPLHFLNNVSSSLGTVLKPAGLDASKDLITALYMKEVTDPQWRNDKGFTDWVAFMKKYYPDGALDDQSNGFGYNVAILMTQVLKQCGNDFSRENIMKQAANVKNFELPLLLPGIKVNTEPDRLRPDRAGAARQVRRREVGAVRRGHRRGPQVAPRAASVPASPAGRPPPGSLFPLKARDRPRRTDPKCRVVRPDPFRELLALDGGGEKAGADEEEAGVARLGAHRAAAAHRAGGLAARAGLGDRQQGVGAGGEARIGRHRRLRSALRRCGNRDRVGARVARRSPSGRWPLAPDTRTPPRGRRPCSSRARWPR